MLPFLIPLLAKLGVGAAGAGGASKLLAPGAGVLAPGQGGGLTMDSLAGMMPGGGEGQPSQDDLFRMYLEGNPGANNNTQDYFRKLMGG